MALSVLERNFFCSLDGLLQLKDLLLGVDGGGVDGVDGVESVDGVSSLEELLQLNDLLLGEDGGLKVRYGTKCACMGGGNLF